MLMTICCITTMKDIDGTSPNEYFSFVTTGTYPFELPNKPSQPMIVEAPHELGAFSLKQETIPGSLIP